MKRFIVLISALFCISLAQDIAGSWTLTGVDVNYYNFARPNAATANEAYGEYMYHTPLYVSDTYGFGASLPLAWLPPGYMFLEVRNGPFGEAGLAFNGVNLNVTLQTDGTGTIPEGSTYPDIELDAESCVTFGQVLPVTDAIIYTSDADSGEVLPMTDITGQPSKNPYAGQAMGSLSLSQSVVFSFFPAVGTPTVSPWFLFFADGSIATSPYPNADGTFNMMGVTGGWIKTEDFDGSIGDADPFGGGDNVDPDLALYWHSVDGYSADTGFGDDGLESDEDGDGSDFDRIFGLPAISATYVDPGFAYGLGFGPGFNHLVAGDIQAPLGDLLYGGCLGQVAAGVYDGCIGQVTAGVNDLCEGAGGPVAAVTGLCYDASQSDDFAGACAYYGAGGALVATCLSLGFDEETCNAAAGQAAPAIEAYCQYVSGGYSCEQAGIDECAVLTNPEFAAGLCGVLAEGLTESETCEEWTASFDESWLDAQAVAVVGMTCSDLSAGLNAGLAAGDPTSIATLDAMAAGSDATGYMSCTDYSAYAVATYTEVTTTDDYDDVALANTIYVMNPDPAFALWNNFVTFNGFMYGESGGNASYLVADYDHDLDFSTVFFVSAATGQPCDPTSGDPYCAIPMAPGTDGVLGTADDGGRLVFNFNPSCVPVIEAMEVQTEFVGFEDGACTHDGDVTGNGAVDVLDVVALVQYVIGNSDLTDEELCRADINGDASVNVLDVVAIVQTIINPRGASATSAEFTRTSNGLEMNANGIVDAVQMTLSHGNDFSIELTDNALVAEYNTNDNQTTLMVVLPVEGELFTATGEYTIDEMIAANADGYIETSMPVSFNLSEAYPNPFNPSTNLDIELSYESNVSVMVYNVMGQMVSVLHDGNMSAGMHSITWDASDLSSGMYIIKAEVANDVLSQKVMLLK